MMENAWKLTEDSRKGMGTKGWKGEDAGASAGARKRSQMSSNIFNTPARAAPAKEENVAANASEQ